MIQGECVQSLLQQYHHQQLIPWHRKNLDLLLMIKIKLLTIVGLISHPFWQGLCIDKNCCFITRSCVLQNVVLQLCSYKLF